MGEERGSPFPSKTPKTWQLCLPLGWDVEDGGPSSGACRCSFTKSGHMYRLPKTL